MDKQNNLPQKQGGARQLLTLFFTMLKIGAFTFGGGYAMISLLENEFVSKRGWMAREEFLDMVAIAESTPGPIAINAATYIGYKLAGLWGALIATVGVVLPSFTVIYLISLFFDAFLSLKAVAAAFRGIQVCVIYLILSAGLKLLRHIKKTPFCIAVMCTVTLCMLTFSLLAVQFSSILYILICGALGLSLYALRALREKKGGGQ